jgi:hypothetical protein
MKKQVERCRRTALAFALVSNRTAGTVDGEGRVHFTPSRDDTGGTLQVPALRDAHPGDCRRG